MWGVRVAGPDCGFMIQAPNQVNTQVNMSAEPCMRNGVSKVETRTHGLQPVCYIDTRACHSLHTHTEHTEHTRLHVGGCGQDQDS